MKGRKKHNFSSGMNETVLSVSSNQNNTCLILLVLECLQPGFHGMNITSYQVMEAVNNLRNCSPNIVHPFG